MMSFDDSKIIHRLTTYLNNFVLKIYSFFNTIILINILISVVLIRFWYLKLMNNF